MSAQSPVPHAWLDGCVAAQRRLEDLLDGLREGMESRPSLLEGWTLGHLLTHLARNADSHTQMVEAAQRGEMVPQYPGGKTQRAGDIEAGHRRPVAELVADVRASNRRLEAVWAATDEETWAMGLGVRSHGLTTIADCVFLRWREVEVHLIDLGLSEQGGPAWNQLNPVYIDHEWDLMLAGLDERLPPEVTVVLVPGDRPSHAAGAGDRRVIVRASARTILGWLFGRIRKPEWPVLGPWG